MLCDTTEVVMLYWTWGWARESSSHIARCSCARDYEELIPRAYKLYSQGLWKLSLCLARDWLVDTAIPSHLSLGRPLLIAKSIAADPVCSGENL